MYCYTQCRQPCSSPPPTHTSCWRLLDTPRQILVGLLWGHCSFFLGPGVHKILFVPSKSLLPQFCSNYRTIVLISHTSKVMLKILQAGLQQYVNHELPDVQAGFRKGTGTRDLIVNICWIIEKTRKFQKNIYFCFIDNAKECSD